MNFRRVKIVFCNSKYKCIFALLDRVWGDSSLCSDPEQQFSQLFTFTYDNTIIYVRYPTVK